MKIIIDIPEERYNTIKSDLYNTFSAKMKEWGLEAIRNGIPLTSEVLADALMEERIRGKLDSDTIFEKDIIPDVKCRLTVDIKDRRPCYCGTELREVWREKEIEDRRMNKENARQAFIGFTEFAKGITGNQDLKIPDDIAKKYEIETASEQESCKMTAKEADDIRNSYLAIEATQRQSCEEEDIAKAFQLGLAFGFGEKHDEMDKVMEEVKKAVTSHSKMGKWINDKCSVCGKGIEDLIASPEWYRNEEPNFCPFCGVKIKIESKEEEYDIYGDTE